MVRIRIDDSHLPHADMAMPLRFAKGCIASDRSVIPLAGDAIKTCRNLLESCPGEAAVHHLAGVIAFIHGNRKSAMAFFADAVALDPNYRYAAEALSDLIAADPGWQSVDDYLSACATGRGALRQRYTEWMTAAFASTDLAAMDHWGQRLSAINNPFIAQLLDIANSRRAAGNASDAFNHIFTRYQSYWHTLAEADVAANSLSYETIPDRQQLAEIVIDRIEPDTATIVEVGAFGGYNLQNIHDRLPEARRASLEFIGIEPAAAACRAGVEVSPAVRFIHAGHEALEPDHPDVPAVFDICIVSRVLMILRPDEAARIINRLAPRTKRLVICDDIANFGGNAPLVREPGEFIILHPFGPMLAAAGFSGMELIPAEVPDRKCTGFIVAKGPSG